MLPGSPKAGRPLRRDGDSRFRSNVMRWREGEEERAQLLAGRKAIAVDTCGSDFILSSCREYIRICTW